MPKDINLLDLMAEEEKGIKKFNKNEKEIKHKKPKRKRKAFAYISIFFIVAFVLFSANANISEQNTSSWFDKIPIIGKIKHLVESADKELKGEQEDRINILLLGMGGKNHQGGYLTDTIILASLQPSAKKAAMLSIPRDMTIPMEDIGWRKINNINAFAEAKNPGGGGMAVSQAISDVLDVPIDYFVRIDFAGFVKIVNELGGVEINVENTIDDYSYPVMGMEKAEPYESRFEHLYIEKGLQKMNGDLALKYVRSRHTPGVEGSDFGRGRRQQKVLQAIKEKVLSKSFLFQPQKIMNIIDEIKEHFSTNLKIWEIIKLWDMFKDVIENDISNKALDNSPNGLLVDMINENGAYILVPRSGDFAEIQYMASNIFSDVPIGTKEIIINENSSVEVRNGTWINGLASKVALDIEKYGFNVVRVGGCSRQDFQKSVIYDLTYGEKMKSLTVLKEKTKAHVSFGMPQWLIEEISKELAKETNPVQPNFILILGQDADPTASGAENIEK